MEEGLRHGGLAVVVGEVARVSMASTRRLQLAAEEGGTTALMLKRWRKNGEDPLAVPSAAMTRWRIACVPGAALPVEGIGRARSEEHTSELQSLMRISYAVFCLKKKN